MNNVKYIWNYVNNDTRFVKQIYNFSDSFMKSCSDGNFEECSMDISKSKHDRYIKYKYAVNMACIGGYFETLKKYLKYNALYLRYLSYFEIFSSVASNGHMEMTKYLYMMNKTYQEDNNDENDELYHVNKSVKWLISNDIFNEISYGFIIENACDNNKREMVMWILFVSENINKKHYIESFLKCCKTGNIEMAKILYKSNDEIFDYDCNQEYFSMACEHGNYDFIKWFLKLCPNTHININNFKYFYFACMDNNIDLLNTFTNKYPKIVSYTAFGKNIVGRINGKVIQ